MEGGFQSSTQYGTLYRTKVSDPLSDSAVRLYLIQSVAQDRERAVEIAHRVLTFCPVVRLSLMVDWVFKGRPLNSPIEFDILPSRATESNGGLDLQGQTVETAYRV